MYVRIHKHLYTYMSLSFYYCWAKGVRRQKKSTVIINPLF